MATLHCFCLFAIKDACIKALLGLLDAKLVEEAFMLLAA